MIESPKITWTPHPDKDVDWIGEVAWVGNAIIGYLIPDTVVGHRVWIAKSKLPIRNPTPQYRDEHKESARKLVEDMWYTWWELINTEKIHESS